MGQGVKSTAEAENRVLQTRSGPGRAALMLQGDTLQPARLQCRRQSGLSCFVEDM